jgi:transposase InsO family protein
MVGLLRFDEFVEVLHFCFAAKKALTFPRISASAFSRAFSAKAFWCSSHDTGTRLVRDITYLRTCEGWLYLATVIDLFSGMVIGWAMAEHMRAGLCNAALRMARSHGHFASTSIVFHSDRGTKYTSDEIQQRCADNGITQSMGAVGVCWDNAVAENFCSHLKTGRPNAGFDWPCLRTPPRQRPRRW